MSKDPSNRPRRAGSIASIYSSTFAYVLYLIIANIVCSNKMSMTNQLRAAMEEQEIQGLLKKDKGKKEDFEVALKHAEELELLKFHTDPVEKICHEFNTSEENGITEEQVTAARKKYGLNMLKEVKETLWIIKLLKEMSGVFSILLWVGAALCFIAYGLYTTDPSNVKFIFLKILKAVFGHCYLFGCHSNWCLHILSEFSERSNNGEVQGFHTTKGNCKKERK